MLVTTTLPPGFKATGVAAGIKASGRPDVALIVSDRPATAALVSTQNPFAAAPVHVSRQHVAGGHARAIVVNSGNANACTGRQGLRDALHMCRVAADLLGIPATEVLVASTGIIGRPMPMHKVEAGIRSCAEGLDGGGSDEAARAILTTDSGPKQTHGTIHIDGRRVTISGMAKGAGMIRPNMATMLAFLTTDAHIAPEPLRKALRDATDTSFNQISVDGCESTNDMAMVLANGAAGNDPLGPDHPDWPLFTAELTRQCIELAKMIAGDGEGATRLLEVTVTGAATTAEARRAARAVVESDLVKTAVHGGDPNWGRIVAAVGSTQVAVDAEATVVWIGEPGCIMHGPGASPGTDARPHMASSTVRIGIHLATGDAEGTAWGCDLSPEYVRFNAEYTT